MRSGVKLKRKDNLHLIKEEAYQWQLLMSSRSLSPSEKKTLDKWINVDPRHKVAFERAGILLNTLDDLPQTDFDHDVLDISALPAKKNNKVMTRWYELSSVTRLSTAIACCVVLACFSLFVYMNLYDGIGSQHLVNQTHRTQVGETKTLSLSDGSVVIMGADTALREIMSDNERKVTLNQGAAVFDVIHDPDRPFSVASGNIETIVLGTVFEVRFNGGTSRVQVSEGTVNVEKSIRIKEEPVYATQSHQLNVGEGLVSYADAQNPTKFKPSLQDFANWRFHRLNYESATIQELLADMQRYSRKAIEFEGDIAPLESTKVTAYFDTRDLDAMLEALSAMFPVEVDSTDPERIVVKIR